MKTAILVQKIAASATTHAVYQRPQVRARELVTAMVRISMILMVVIPVRVTASMTAKTNTHA